MTLWLPGTGAGPVASPELARAASADAGVGDAAVGDSGIGIRHRGSGFGDAGTAGVATTYRPPARTPATAGAARPGRVRLSPWLVPALSLDPAGALALLSALSQAGARAERGILSGSVHYIAALAALAADLTARGRVLPGVSESGDRAEAGASQYTARWRPVLAGADALRARELTIALPPLCRATSAEGEPSATIVGEALDALTDAAVRTRLSAAPGFELLPAGPAAPLTDRWAAALTSPDGLLSVAPGELAHAAQLAFVLWAWQDAAQEPPGPVRTCFRLIEPDRAESMDRAECDLIPRRVAPARAAVQAEPAWEVQFALQSTDDPSLLLPAADVWSGITADGWAAAGISYPEDDLLAGLGRASRLFPELDGELQGAAPASVDLDTRGALRFLKETGPLLAAAGFGVLLPDWVRRSRLGLKLTTRSRTATGPGSVTAPKFGLADLVDFRYELAVGDQTLDPDELAELARLKVPLVRLRGQWVELDERHLKAALQFLERGGAGVMSAGDALLAGIGESAGELPLTEVDADGWLGDLLSGQADGRLEPMATPASFRGELRPYQERGLAWLSFLGNLGLGAVLADDMGLGKSPQTLALLAAERDSGTATGPTLLICPMSLVGNWQHEAARFTPGLAVHVHHGSDRLAGPELAAAVAAADLVITTYGVATRDREALAQVPWSRLVCDEAQNIKNAATLQARGGADNPGRLAHRTDRHASGEPADRAVVDPGVHQPRPARPGRAIPAPLRHPDRAQLRRRRHRAAETRDRTVHPAPAEDR